MATVWSGSVPEQRVILLRLNQEKEISYETEENNHYNFLRLRG